MAQGAAARFFRRLGIALLVLLTVGGISYFHFSRNSVPGVLTPDAMDAVQSARQMARSGGFTTNVIRPLWTNYVLPNNDGSIANIAQPPLYLALCATALRITRQTGAGSGERIIVLLTLGLFVLSTGAAYLLARRLFGAKTALLAVLFYAFGGIGLSVAIMPQPAPLGAVLFTLLLLALYSLDRIAPAGEPDRKVSPWWGVFAGALFGLLWLTVYSSLLLFPAVLIYILRVARRDFRLPALFVVTALLVATPLCLRNFRLSRNPIYNVRLNEVMMNTETYPGFGLYRQSSLPVTVIYFTTNRTGEIFRKTARNLGGFYSQAPAALGLLVLPLFLGAGLTRFTDNRINRLRGLVFLLMPLHFLGLSAFLPYVECVPIFLMYGPFAATLAAAFLLAVVRARNFPRFFEWMAVVCWTALAILPGLVSLFAPVPLRQEASSLYAYLNGDSEPATAWRNSAGTLLVADSPWEVAYRNDRPVAWLPADSTVAKVLEDRSGRVISGVALSASLPYLYGNEADAAPWVGTYGRVVAVTQLATNLPATLSRSVMQKLNLFFPPQVGSLLREFAPVPVAEPNGSYDIVFWRTAVPTTRR